MSDQKPIKSALISVYYKDGLEPIARELSRQGVTIYSTGGTQDFLEALGIEIQAVEDLTSYPSILGGRVKTFHPASNTIGSKIFSFHKLVKLHLHKEKQLLLLHFL